MKKGRKFDLMIYLFSKCDDHLNLHSQRGVKLKLMSFRYNPTRCNPHKINREKVII